MEKFFLNDLTSFLLYIYTENNMNFFLTLLAGIVISATAAFSTTTKIFTRPVQTRHAASLPNNQPDVLGETTVNDSVTFNVDAIFNKELIVKGGKITANNIVYGIRAGAGVGVGSSDPQNPTIINTGVLSVQGKTGELKLEQGSGITIDGLKISNSGITSLTSGTGISVSGSTITNSDLGSSQNIFKTISVTGQNDIVAGSNADTLTFVAGAGVTLTTDSTTKMLTITSNDPSVAAGWTKLGNNIYLTTSTNSVGIGTTDPTHKLEVSGTGSFSDTLTAGGALDVTGGTTLTGALLANGNVTLGNATSDSLTFVGRITNGTSLLPDTDLGSDLGSSSNRFNNLWVANINSNSSQAFSGQTVFSYAPTDATLAQASVIINPTTSFANGQLLGLGIAGYEKALIDKDGDLILGYNNLTSAPATDNPLMIYGHNGTNVASVDVSGNSYFSGNLDVNGTTNDITGTLNLSGNALTSSGALSITPNAGSNVNLNLSGTGDFVVNSNQLAVDTSSGYVGIGTTAPTAKLDIAATSGTDALRLTSSGTKVLGLSYGTNSITLDAPSTDPTNKLSNGTFESDLTSWSEVPSYTLNDQFTTDRSAGAVNGTSAEPTGGTRTVVDTTSALSIASSTLTFSGRGSTSWGNPAIWYPVITRTAGKTLVGKTNIAANLNSGYMIGWDTGITTYPDANALWFLSGNLFIFDSGGGPAVGTYSTSTDYQTAILLRSTGAYHFVKGGTYANWTLLWISAMNSTSSLYPNMTSEGTTITADNIRIPTSTWLPTPLAYDTFTRADGAISTSETTGPDSQTTPGLTWTGGAISGNTLKITPSLGSELIVNGGFDSDTVWVKNANWTIGSSVASSNGSTGHLQQNSLLTIGNWYQGTWDIVTRTSGVADFYIGADWKSHSSVGSFLDTGRALATYVSLYSNSLNGTVDNISFKPLTLSSLFSSVSTSDADVIADANVTLTAGTQAGLVINLDSTSSPANFVIAYHDGTNVHLEKAVAGVYTSLINTAATYVAGATLRVIKDATKYRVYYNNALVGTEQTISDAGIISNTKHGLFSTYASNSFDNFTLWPRGSSTTKFTDAPFEELTATRVTTPTYNGSSGSVQLVTTGTDANYVQSVNVGDTATYTETAYAYTTGAAVTSSDLSLYANGAAITTAYSPLGSTGWYKLTGTFTGIASAQNIGVRVKAGKTVYVDSVTVTSGVGTSDTLYVLNSGTGTTKLSVQDTTTLNAGSNSSIGLIVKGYSTGQTANLQEWQNSGGTTLGSVSNAGLATFNSVSASSVIGNVSLGGEGLKLISGGNTKAALRYVADGSVALDTQTASGSNKFTNSNFDSGITGWNYGNTLSDTFSTDVAAGSVNGTAADTGGNRTVVDTENKLNVGGGNLNFTGVKTSPSAGDPAIIYPAVSRVAGKILTNSINMSVVGDYFPLALGLSATGNFQNYNNLANGFYVAPTSISAGDTTGHNVGGTLSSGTLYNFALILKSTGAYYYIKGGTYTNWTLLWISSTGNTASLYPVISNWATNSTFTADNIRIPTSTWLPTPLAYDTFTRGDGAIGSSETTGPDSQTTPSLAWTGGAISGNKVVITPSLGSELVTNGDMETGNPPSNWTANGQTLSSVADERTGGSGAQSLSDAKVDTNWTYQAPTIATGTWVNLSTWIKNVSATYGAIQIYQTTGTGSLFPNSTSSSWTNKFVTGRINSTNPQLQLYISGSAGNEVRYDDISYKPLTLSSLFSSVSTSDADVIADANVTMTSGTQAGLVLNLDSTSSPANFVIAYHDGTNVHLEKAVAGVYTSLINTAATYSAGATLRVIKSGTAYRVYYNNVLIGTEQTISDAGIISNTKHGLFSTYASNSFDNFTLWARGTGNEYVDLPDTNLTATAETSITYGASTGSTKLVAGSSGSAYSQSVNVGDTSTYTLSTAVYTTGAAVTSADMEMTAGGILLPTTFTSLGSGWYRASATVTGVATSTPYGVYVHSGRTVYVDNLTLIASTALASTFTVQNTLTGLGQMTVESTTTLNSGLSTLQAMIVKGALSQSANLTEWQNSTGSVLANLSSSGLLNATVGGVATLSKAGTISDADFTSPVDGLMGIDTTNHRVYFREGGAWSFAAKAGGFQIPNYEVTGLLTGDYLMPYVESFMEDGAIHGLYQKFDLNKVLATQGAVTFVSDVTFLGKTKFNKDTAGTAIISTYSNQVDVKFTNIYDVAPIVTMNLVNNATDSAFLEEGQKAYLTNITTEGFSIMLPTLALRDFTYNWIALPIDSPTESKSQSPLRQGFEGQALIQQIIDNQVAGIATPSAVIEVSPSPTLTIAPLGP